MSGIRDTLANAPALWTAVFFAAIGLLVTLNLPITDDQRKALEAVTVAIFALLQGVVTHSHTTPNAHVDALISAGPPRE